MAVLVMALALALLGCESDADRIRATNAAPATATPTATSAPATATRTNAPTAPTATQAPATPTPTSTTSAADRVRAVNEAAPTPTPTPLSARIDAIDLQDGDCINSTIPDGIDIYTVVIVPCAESWQYRVLGLFEVAGGFRYPGEDLFDRRAYESCDRRHSTFLFPTEESWAGGDRKVNCLQESFGLSVSDPAKLDRLAGYRSLQTGECYNEAPVTDDSLVELVNCEGEWEYRVVSSFNVADADSYPGEDFFAQQAYEGCDRGYSYYLGPSAESWAGGDRTVGCLQESFGLSVSDPAKLDRLVNYNSLQTEECFNKAPETDDYMAELVSCEGEWESRVVSSFEVANADSYPGEDFFAQQAYEGCDRRYSYYLSPSAESWILGDRTILCIQDSFELSVSNPAKLDRLANYGSLQTGECYNEAPETDYSSIELVSCEGGWEYKVVNLFDVPDSDLYPGEDFFDQQASERCERGFSYYLDPSAESWVLGDRTVLCLQDSP